MYDFFQLNVSFATQMQKHQNTNSAMNMMDIIRVLLLMIKVKWSTTQNFIHSRVFTYKSKSSSSKFNFDFLQPVISLLSDFSKFSVLFKNPVLYVSFFLSDPNKHLFLSDGQIIDRGCSEKHNICDDLSSSEVACKNQPIIDH